MDFKQDCSNRLNQVDFVTVFAVMFSGVTGVMAGVNMSAELKNPGKSIPNGTLWACATTGVMLIVEMILIALTCSRSLIYNDCFFMEEFTLWRPIIGIIQ